MQVQGDDGAGCGVVACGAQGGSMQYVGCGSGDYQAVTTYKYVGYGGDFSSVRRRRDFTCLIVTSLLSLLLVLLALTWWYWPADECSTDQANWQTKWGKARQIRCCALVGVGCNQAAPGPVDPFNCASGYLNWQAGWSATKKDWCCKVHRKGCGSPFPSKASEYDCEAGFPNWVKGWSVNKKNWCCEKQGKGCLGSGHENMLQAAFQGYGAGAELVPAPVAHPNLGTM